MRLIESIRIMKALADSSRLTIMNALLERPHYVEELSERVKLAVSTVSFHLKKLEQASLVEKKKEQYYVMFSANQQALNMRLQELIVVQDIKKTVQEERIQQYREKVMHSFIRDGRLIRMPAQQKKRRIILEEIAKQFQTGRTYKEKKVNEVILKVFDDYCTIRREMIGWKIMAREGENYWRLDTELSGPSLLAPQKTSSGEGKMDRRKELKQQYKQSPQIAGVFQIKNLKNGKIFVGSGLNLQGKLNSHKIQLQVIGSHRNKALLQDWKEYGPENFSFDILETLELQGELSYKERKALNDLEKLWLGKLQPYGEKGYNKRPN